LNCADLDQARALVHFAFKSNGFEQKKFSIANIRMTLFCGPGSISPTYYKQLLRANIPNLQKDTDNLTFFLPF